MQSKKNGTPRRAPRRAGGPSAPATQHPAQWRQSFERYKALAEEAGRSADGVAQENYYQHAEHYLRLIHEAGQR